MNMTKRVAQAMCLVFSSMSVVTATTWHVAPVGDDVNNTGVGWDSPFATIGKAVAEASDNDEVVVSNGVYTLSAQIVVDKAITVRSLAGAAVTTVDGNNATRGFFINHANAVVDGFTIKRGLGSVAAGYGSSGFTVGGGVLLDGGRLVNASILTNSANEGGGVFVKAGSSVVSNCLVQGNSATRYGGGVAAFGANPGGRLYNNTVRQNTGWGAVWIVDGYMANNVVTRNSDPANYTAGIRQRGGANVNSLVYGNTANGHTGAGLYVSEGGLVENNTIVYNTASAAGGSGAYSSGLRADNFNDTSVIRNTIVWGNVFTGSEVLLPPLGSMTYSCWPAGTSGTGNISSNPQFVNAGADNFALAAISPCIDKGNFQSWMTGAKDVAGNPRIVHDGVDMGALEFTGTKIVICANPTFDPPAGTFTSAYGVEVSLATATPDATIRYTTDGSDPSASLGTVYTGPLNITATTTLKAIAFKDGAIDSEVAAAVYTISPPTQWTDYIEQSSFYAGDAHGTACHDVYTDQANPATNFDGQGLNLRFSQSVGSDRRPGYIRFEGFEANLPADAFVIEAFLQLTANAQSTVDYTDWRKYTQGALLIAARRGAFDAATATWNTLASRFEIAPEAGAQDQLWGHAFEDKLASNDVARANVTPAVRAWIDRHRNSGHGYPNDGFALNIDIGQGFYPSGTVSFFDSETADPLKRPRLVVRYLRPSSGYRAHLFQPVPVATSHITPAAVEDAMIRNADQNQGWANQHTNNYGGMTGWYSITTLDPSAMLFRWTGMASPDDPQYVVDARLRLNGLSGWTQATSGTGPWQIRKVLRPWVEGVGAISWSTQSSTSHEGVTWASYNAVSGDPSQNLWAVPGGTGAADSTALFNLGYRTRDGEVLVADSGGVLLDLISDWQNGADNNGLMFYPTGQERVPLYFANLGGSHRDPYLSPGLLLIVKPPKGTLFILR